MKPMEVKARLLCPHCQAQVTHQIRQGPKQAQRDETSYIYVCHNSDCKHYLNDTDGVKPQIILTCPKCDRESAHCLGKDIGAGNDFWDQYSLYCNHCGALEFVTEYGGQKDMEHLTYCPYCSQTVYAHLEPSAEKLKLFTSAGADYSDGRDFSVFEKSQEEQDIAQRLELPAKHYI